MFLGHYGVAFAAKRFAPRTSLGTFSFAAEFLDELWPILLLLGVEQVRIVPGLMAANSLDFVSYPISHSLAAALVWSLLIGGIYFARTHYRAGALVAGGLVLSHWFLDLPMHRPDLPLWPGPSPKLGFGLWNSIPATLAVEFLILGLGLGWYITRTRARDRVGSWGLWAMVVLLVGFYVGGTFTPPPPDPHALALGTLGLWLFVPWSYWVDRHRVLRSPHFPAS